MYGKKGAVMLSALALLSLAGHSDRRSPQEELRREAERLHIAADRLTYHLGSHPTGRHLRHESLRLATVAADLERAAAAGRQRGIAEALRQVEDRFYALRHRFHTGLSLTHGHDQWYSDLLANWREVVESSSRLRRISHGRPPRDPVDFRDDLFTVRCRSEDYRPAECNLSGRIVDLRLIKQKSRAACVPAQTYGYEGNSIWVSEGCDGEFRVRISY